MLLIFLLGGRMKYFIWSMIFTLSLNLRAASYRYDMSGDFKISLKGNKVIPFSLNWTEEDGALTGVYSDNYFGKSVFTKGLAESSGGFTILADFKKEIDGVRSFTILIPKIDTQKVSEKIQLTFILRNLKGDPIKTFKVNSKINSISFLSAKQLQEEHQCTEGFGVLEGYCGIYAGMITEEWDRRNKCNLLFADAVRLELTNNGVLLLHLGEVNNLIKTQFHNLGRIPFNPQKKSIDILNRVCFPMSGFNSSIGDACKILHLRGVFSSVRQHVHFEGSYTISEEGSNNQCKYKLSMDMI